MEMISSANAFSRPAKAVSDRRALLGRFPAHQANDVFFRQLGANARDRHGRARCSGF
jgi:hypothetical protein